MAQDEVSSEVCDKCGAAMVVKAGRFGKFLACSNYPECKNTKKIGAEGKGKAEAAQSIPVGEDCEKCGSPLVYRKGRFGPFIACSNYPSCRYTKRIAKIPEVAEQAAGAAKPEEQKPAAAQAEKKVGAEKKTRKKKD